MRKTFESNSPFIGLNTKLFAFERVRNKKKQANKNIMSLGNKNEMKLVY